MKYIISFFVFLSFVPFFADISLAATCEYKPWSSVSNTFKNDSSCKPNGVITATDYVVGWGARDRVIAFADKLTIFAAVLAVGAVVYSSIMLVLSLGDEEKIKKAKGSLKTSLIGFLLALISYALVNAIINFVYDLSGK